MPLLSKGMWTGKFPIIYKLAIPLEFVLPSSERIPDSFKLNKHDIMSKYA